MPDRHPGLGGIRFVLGGNAFGWTIDRDASFAVLDVFYEAGGRSIDSAEGYSSWVPGNKGGESETIIGEWMESRGVRRDMKIATKTGMGGPVGALAPDRVAAACECSLQRLRTDYIDLYYVHRDDGVTAAEDVASGYGALVASGKVCELAVSNTPPARLEAFNAAARIHGGTSFTAVQPGYNLVWRNEYPEELEAIAVRDGLAVIPYYGLAAGFLSGKYQSEADFGDGMRQQNAKMFATELGWRGLAVAREIAAELGATVAQVALAWLASRPAVWGPLASATSPQQVRDLVACVSLTLSAEQTARLTAVSIDAHS